MLLLSLLVGIMQRLCCQFHQMVSIRGMSMLASTTADMKETTPASTDNVSYPKSYVEKVI
jgi:hypothetical protein